VYFQGFDYGKATRAPSALLQRNAAILKSTRTWVANALQVMPMDLILPLLL
jgi:hypothetical protein